MYQNKCEIPIMLQKLQALHRRLPSNHEKSPKIKEDFSKQIAGYNGVVSAKYFFHLINHNFHQILFDIRLTNDGIHFFQMDILLLCENFILILEVKNIAGILYFDTKLNQCIRTHQEKEEGFSDPILQVQRQRKQLISWLQKQRLPPIPVIPLVVISNPSTIIKSNDKDISKYVIHAGTLPHKIQQFEKIYAKQTIQQKEVKSLSRNLLKRNQPQDAEILPKYGINPDEIKTGVQCGNCFYIPMGRVRGEWICPKCKDSSMDGHLHALVDYSLLISNSITNRQLRSFLHINSMYTASRMLGSLNLEREGAANSRKYVLDQNLLAKITI